MAITTFKTSPITTTFKGGSQCDVHRLVLPSLGQHRQLRQGAAVLQGSLHPLPNPIFSLILILMPIFVHQSIKNSSARLSSSSILIPFLPSSSCSSFLINPSRTVLSSSSSSWRPSSSGLHPQPHQLIKSIIISFLISLVITIISWWSQLWWSVFTILMISSHNLDPHADHHLDDQELVDLFNFHRFDNLRHSDKKKLDPRRESFEVSFWRKKHQR